MTQIQNFYQKNITLIMKNPWGILLSYLTIFSIVYGITWFVIEPLGILDSFKPLIVQFRILFYLSFVSLISSHLLIIFIFINKLSNKNQSFNFSNINTYLEQISFSFQDTSILQCWKVVEKSDPNEPILKKEIDGIMGEFLSISGSSFFALDYQVKVVTRNAKILEYIVIPQNDHVLYLNVDVITADGSQTKNCWVNLGVNKLKIKPYGDGKIEWDFPITHVSRTGDWLKYQVNIDEAIKKTFGTEGWKYKNLNKLRLRGNSKIKTITIY
jgi:hypothetical protein